MYTYRSRGETFFLELDLKAFRFLAPWETCPLSSEAPGRIFAEAPTMVWEQEGVNAKRNKKKEKKE